MISVLIVDLWNSKFNGGKNKKDSNVSYIRYVS